MHIEISQSDRTASSTIELKSSIRGQTPIFGKIPEAKKAAMTRGLSV
jgi:hypothetical protein